VYNNKISHSLQLENSLFKYCRSGTTGTAFITTENNRSCQIVLTDGRITAASSGDKRGLGAVSELQEICIKRFSFIKDMQFPLTVYANIDCSNSALNLLGYSEIKRSDNIKVSETNTSSTQIHSESQQTFCTAQLEATQG